MKMFLKTILTLSLFLPLVGHTQNQEGLYSLNNQIEWALQKLEIYRNPKLESFNGARVGPQVDVVKQLFKQRVEQYDQEPSVRDCDRLGNDHCGRISAYLKERNEKLSTCEGVEMEITRLRKQLETYQNDSFRLGNIHGDLAGMFIRLSDTQCDHRN